MRCHDVILLDFGLIRTPGRWILVQTGRHDSKDWQRDGGIRTRVSGSAIQRLSYLDKSGRLTIRRSKTDQTGAGAVLYLGPLTVRALDAISPADADPCPLVIGRRWPRKLPLAPLPTAASGLRKVPSRAGERR